MLAAALHQGCAAAPHAGQPGTRAHRLALARPASEGKEQGRNQKEEERNWRLPKRTVTAHFKIETDLLITRLRRAQLPRHVMQGLQLTTFHASRRASAEHT